MAGAVNDGGSPAASSAVCPGDPVGQIYPASNPWNVDISAFPVHSNSANLVSSIGTAASLHPDFGTVLDSEPWGIPFIVVDGTQPYLPVNFTLYGNQSDPGPYPTPLDAPVEGGTASTGDRHVLVYNSSNRFLYELYYAFPQPARWKAGSGAVFDTMTNFRRPLDWTSADAAGLSILAGLVRYEEVACGAINHALRFTAQVTRQAYIYPASHQAGSTTSVNAPAMGQRYRLKASKDISGFGTQARIILQAMKTYGIIVADNGGNWFVSGAPNPNWDDTVINTLKQIKGSDFEAVDTSSLVPPTDITAPAGPANLNVSAAGLNQLNVSWPAATDAVGVIGYRVLVSTTADFANPLSRYNRAYLGNALTTSLTQLAAATQYFVKVIAYDEAGNASAGATGSATTSSAGTRKVRQLISD
jgi:hypothetical protein